MKNLFASSVILTVVFQLFQIIPRSKSDREKFWSNWKKTLDNDKKILNVLDTFGGKQSKSNEKNGLDISQLNNEKAKRESYYYYSRVPDPTKQERFIWRKQYYDFFQI